MADQAVDQYREMLSSVRNRELFSSFDEYKDRLDELFVKVIDGCRQKELLFVVKKSLLLSHGTAKVESGFSINKELIDDYQDISNLVSLRRCKDGLSHYGGIRNFAVTKRVLLAVRGARSRYEKDKKTTAEQERVNLKGKKNEEIAVLSAKIKRRKSEADHLLELADKKAVECEKRCELENHGRIKHLSAVSHNKEGGGESS